MTNMELNEMKGLWSLYQSTREKSEELDNAIDNFLRAMGESGPDADMDQELVDMQVEADNWYIQNEYPAFNSLVESVAYHFGLSSKQARQIIGSPKFSRMMQGVTP